MLLPKTTVQPSVINAKYKNVLHELTIRQSSAQYLYKFREDFIAYIKIASLDDHRICTHKMHSLSHKMGLPGFVEKQTQRTGVSAYYVSQNGSWLSRTSRRNQKLYNQSEQHPLIQINESWMVGVNQKEFIYMILAEEMLYVK